MGQCSQKLGSTDWPVKACPEDIYLKLKFPYKMKLENSLIYQTVFVLFVVSLMKNALLDQFDPFEKTFLSKIWLKIESTPIQKKKTIEKVWTPQSVVCSLLFVNPSLK